MTILEGKTEREIGYEYGLIRAAWDFAHLPLWKRLVLALAPGRYATKLETVVRKQYCRGRRP